MSEMVRFTNNHSGEVLGTATLTDEGALECSTPWVENKMRARRTLFGDERAFRFFAGGWSDDFGRVSSALIEE